jgi:hypothetical protein
MFATHYEINETDTTASSAGTSLNFASWKSIWSSSQCSSNYGWYVNNLGNASSLSKTTNYFVAPVLEVPNH